MYERARACVYVNIFISRFYIKVNIFVALLLD